MSYTDYSKEVTEESRQLLKHFLTLVKEKGVKVVVIGGWAVEAFVKGPGSKDIDIVIQNGKDISKLSSDDFFSPNTLDEVQQGWPLQYKKEIFVNGEDKEIICEIFNGELEKEDYGKVGIKIHWDLTQKFNETREIDGFQLQVPKKELLIILKIIAAVDRKAIFDLRGGKRLPSKIWKDYRDIATLCYKQKLDQDFLKTYMKQSGLMAHMKKFLAGYKAEYKQIVDNLKTTPEELDSILGF